MAENRIDEKFTAIFIQLLLSFQAAAWQQLGKVKNPFTDKIERNLEQAHHTIDMLEMLRVKSQGNLSDDEKSFLDRTISELQLNFVAEADRDKEAPDAKNETAGKDTQDKRIRPISRTAKSRRQKLRVTIRKQQPKEKVRKNKPKRRIQNRD
jgi:hypothetical protein